MRKFFIIIIVLIIVVLIGGSVAYLKGRDVNWDDEKIKTENVILAIQKMIRGANTGLLEIKTYLNLVDPLKNEPIFNKVTVDNPLIPAYEAHYQTSLAFIEKLKKHEADAKELLKAIENRDVQTFRSLKKQFLADIKTVDEEYLKYKETSDNILILQNKLR